MNSVFVTGTDTEVGKTRISIALIEWYQQHSQRVAAMKPIASGCDETVEGLRNDDALLLAKQADVDIAYDVMNPYHFAEPIAPHIAAQQSGINIDLTIIKQNFELIQQQSDVVVVEGAGGWLVPINNTHTMADLAITLKLPVVLVVAIRLGCINHALLTVAAITQSGLPLQAWVANCIEPNEQAEAIIATLTQRIAAPCLAVIPQLAEQQSAVEFFK